jgi:hypothetical protein
MATLRKSLCTADSLWRCGWLRRWRRARSRQKSAARKTSADLPRHPRDRGSMGRFAMGWPVGSIDLKADERPANACRGGQHCGADVKARAVFLCSRVPTTLPLVTQSFSLTRGGEPLAANRGVERPASARAPRRNDTVSKEGAYWAGQTLRMNRRSDRQLDQGRSGVGARASSARVVAKRAANWTYSANQRIVN